MNKKTYLIFGIFLIIFGILYLGINLIGILFAEFLGFLIFRPGGFDVISILIILSKPIGTIILGIFFIKFSRKNREDNKLIKIAFIGIILYSISLLIFYFISTPNLTFNIDLILNHTFLGFTVMDFLLLTSLTLLIIDYFKNRKTSIKKIKCQK